MKKNSELYLSLHTKIMGKILNPNNCDKQVNTDRDDYKKPKKPKIDLTKLKKLLSSNTSYSNNNDIVHSKMALSQIYSKPLQNNKHQRHISDFTSNFRMKQNYKPQFSQINNPKNTKKIHFKSNSINNLHNINNNSRTTRFYQKNLRSSKSDERLFNYSLKDQSEGKNSNNLTSYSPQGNIYKNNNDEVISNIAIKEFNSSNNNFNRKEKNNQNLQDNFEMKNFISKPNADYSS